MAISPITPPASHAILDTIHPAQGTTPVNLTQNQASVKPTLPQAVPSVETLNKVAEMLNKKAQLSNIGVNFQVDNRSGKLVITVIDRETQEVIRQIPSQEAVDLSESSDWQQGLLYKGKT